MALKAVATLVPGGGPPVGGSGTAGKLTKWATTSTLDDSVITQSGAGNIGIGTAIPGDKLTIAGTAGTCVISMVETGVRNWAIRSGGVATNVFDICDLSAAASRIAITSAGNVGIGTTGPSGALDVNGTIRTASYTVGTLPAGVVGQRAYVTDALAPTYLGALVGGGAVLAPVFRNATVWVSA